MTARNAKLSTLGAVTAATALLVACQPSLPPEPAPTYSPPSQPSALEPADPAASPLNDDPAVIALREQGRWIAWARLTRNCSILTNAGDDIIREMADFCGGGKESILLKISPDIFTPLSVTAVDDDTTLVTICLRNSPDMYYDTSRGELSTTGSDEQMVVDYTMEYSPTLGGHVIRGSEFALDDCPDIEVTPQVFADWELVVGADRSD